MADNSPKTGGGKRKEKEIVAGKDEKEKSEIVSGSCLLLGLLVGVARRSSCWKICGEHEGGKRNSTYAPPTPHSTAHCLDFLALPLLRSLLPPTRVQGRAVLS